MVIETKQIPLISSIHGRDRRLQREIGKYDLQAAIKHGERELQPWNRWKFTYRNIVYITEYDKKREVTSYVLPVQIPSIELTPNTYKKHDKVRQSVSKNPETCTSFTVIVVDQSGSMRTCDVQNFKTRSDAAYGTIALDFIGKQLDTNDCKVTDLVTIIEMKDEATTVLDCEPMTNVLYNKVLVQKILARPRSHGHYLGALESAYSALSKFKNVLMCPLKLIFLSDGAPSDRDFSSIYDEVMGLAQTFGQRLTVDCIGFGNNEFNVLKSMKEVAIEVGANSTFANAKEANDLSITMTSIVTDIVATRLTTGQFGQTERVVGVEKAPSLTEARKSIIINSDNADWSICKVFDRLHFDYGAKDKKYYPWKSICFEDERTIAVAIRKKKFAASAERIVYFFRELRELGENLFQAIGPALVAKESRFIPKYNEFEKEKAQIKFCRTQECAHHMALRFNTTVSSLFRRHQLNPMNAAKIEFLDCSVYGCFDKEGIERWLLVEPLLDTTRYQKWNTNDGFVYNDETSRHHVKILDQEDSLHDMLALNGETKPAKRLVVREMDESDEDEDDTMCDTPTISLQPRKNISVEEFPQAFSHFTYIRSNRKMLVCDLQGELNRSKYQPSVFRLTDPVIHHESQRHENSKFGRTDLGRKGFTRFFKTHKCNSLCQLLGLPNDKC